MSAAAATGHVPTREVDLRPNAAVLLVATAAIALVSAASLPWPAAAASTLLGTLMAAGADVDARTHLLPDAVTWGATVCGVAAACWLAPYEPFTAGGTACLRAALTGTALALLRLGYGRLRGREGLGLGDVKLAAASGAWLPAEAVPLCFALAAGAALVAVTLARLGGRAMGGSDQIAFGAFLCPALWLSFYASTLSS